MYSNCDLLQSPSTARVIAGDHALTLKQKMADICRRGDQDPPLVLATVAGEEFVFGATTQWQEGHSNGHTTVEEKSTKTCSGQHIEQISQSSNLGPLRVIGTLTACPGLPQFVLQLATAPGGQV